MTASAIIARLDRVRECGPGKWLARCPSHEDRSPSLSIRELDDGRMLIHCHAGCDPADVVGALGLTLADLFPDRLPEHRYSPSPLRNEIPARDLLTIVDHEITVAALILNDAIERRTINQTQLDRLCLASVRVGKARAAANPAKVARHAA